MSICTPITSVVTAPCQSSCISAAVSSAGCAQTDYSCYCDVGPAILLEAFDCAIVPCGNLQGVQILNWYTASGISFCDCITASEEGAGGQTAVVLTTEPGVVSTSAVTFTDIQGGAASSTVGTEVSTSSAIGSEGGVSAGAASSFATATITGSRPGETPTITVRPVLGQSSSGASQSSSTPPGVTSSSTTSSGLGLKIGLGVGIPVAALLLVGLVFFILYKRKSDQRIRGIQAQLDTVSGQLRDNRERPPEEPVEKWKREQPVSPIVSPISPRPSEVPGEGWKVELDGPTARVHELHENSVMQEPNVPSRGPV